MKTCIDAFKCIFIENANHDLRISPCCYSPVRNANEIDFQNNEYLNSIRESWRKEEWNHGCLNCKKDEDKGLISRRLGSNEWYTCTENFDTDVSLLRMDYWVGDTCNLKCVTCGPEYSSSWKQELKFPIVERKVRKNNFWKQLDLSSLRWIHFNGGEPLLDKGHIELLKAVPQKSVVHVMYNTNTTILPSQELIDVLSQFESVCFSLSIDDINEQFEYLRFPAKWETILKNVEIFKNKMPENVTLMITRVVSTLNFKRLHLLEEWVKATFGDIKISNLYGEFIFDINSIEENKEGLIGYLNEIDNRRGTNWKTTFPEIAELIL